MLVRSQAVDRSRSVKQTEQLKIAIEQLSGTQAALDRKERISVAAERQLAERISVATETLERETQKREAAEREIAAHRTHAARAQAKGKHF